MDDRSERAGDRDAAFRDRHDELWGLAYRLTGSAEDAHDVVQEGFARLLAQPARVSATDSGPWLVRIVTHLGVNALQRRRRCSYPGPWLPSPIESDDPEPLPARPIDEPTDPEPRYGLAESITFAFLVALEALGPRQRAVLLLRDVLGYPARETAEHLRTSEGKVRLLHFRARKALEAYDSSRCLPTAELREKHRDALERLLGCLRAQDAPGVEALLSESVRTVTDSAGRFTALSAPLAGRDRVARFCLKAAFERQAGGSHHELRLVNGLPAILIALGNPVRRQAPRTLLRCELDETGRIELVHAVVAPRKLASLRSIVR